MEFNSKQYLSYLLACVILALIYVVVKYNNFKLVPFIITVFGLYLLFGGIVAIGDVIYEQIKDKKS